MNKKAFSLSINFVVILILALAALSIGFMVSYRALKHAEEVRLQLDSETESQIEAYLASGDLVAIPLNKKNIDDGTAMFGLGVLNVERQLDSNAFSLNISSCTYYDTNGNPSPCALNDYEIQTTVEEGFMLEQNEEKKIAILVKILRPESGLYSFKIIVNKGAEQYGAPQIIYINVP